ncbi:unnamed protein product [Cylindrotheca closterium]|uniref:Uncharacterized protein n=1 Tax=Cylindrotheca closterium TaxID=2856 RepID=A0AAD2G6H2_9STRA|nr:unnamed protein product [Cylindrotheca closterium]
MKFFLGAVASLCVQVPDVAFEMITFSAAIVFANNLKLIDFGCPQKSMMNHIQILRMMPSRTTCTRYTRRFAAHNVIFQRALMLGATALFLGADKGGGSLVKKVYLWFQGLIYDVDLDFDGSGEDAASCGDACYHLFLKFVFGNDKHSQLKGIVKGGGSDSGGGFTNGKMKEELVRKGLANKNEYIHCPCTSHNDQTNLHNATESIFGEGGIEKRNVMQLLHALSDFQNDFSHKYLYLDLREAAHHDKFPDKATVPKDLL